MKRIKSFLFLSAFLFGGAFAFSQPLAAPSSCLRYLETHSLEKPTGLYQKYLWWKLFKAWRAQKPLSSRTFQKAVRNSAQVLMTLRHQQQDPAFTALSEEEKKMYSWAERAVLTEEFKELQRFEKQRSLFFSLLYHTLTLSLPEKTDRSMSKDLLSSLQRDGIFPHWEEVKAAYGQSRQSGVESYRSLQKTAQVLFVALSLVGSYAHSQNVIHDLQDSNKAQIFQTLEQMDQGLDRLEALVDQKIKERNETPPVF
jgi:hypothetical protein